MLRLHAAAMQRLRSSVPHRATIIPRCLHPYLHSGTDGQADCRTSDAVRLKQEEKQTRSEEEYIHLNTHRQAEAHAARTPPEPQSDVGELAIVSMNILLLPTHLLRGDF